MKYLWITLLILLVAFTDGQVPSAEPPTGSSSKPESTANATTAEVDKNTDNTSSTGSFSEATTSTPTQIATTTPSVNSTVSPVTNATGINSNSSVNIVTTPKDSSSTTEITPSTGDLNTTVLSPSSIGNTTSKSEVTSISTTDSSATTTTVDFLLAGVKISETNILLTDSDNADLFVEIRSTSDVESVWLVILDANKTTKDQQLLLKHECNISKNTNGIHTYVMNNETEFWNRSRNLESVLIALYANSNSADSLNMNGLYDILLYSSFGNIHAGLIEEFSNQDLIIIDHKQLKSLQGISLSRCSEEEKANTATVLTYESPGKINLCNLTINQSLEMKLTIASEDCSSVLAPNFNYTLAKKLIIDVNDKEHCGFAFFMLRDMKINTLCSPKPKVKEIQVGFTVKSAFLDQLDLIKKGFESQSKLYLETGTYNLSICFQNCFPIDPVPTKPADNRVRVTVTVVISCITVFLLVVLFLFLYMRRKKKGILQFSMARLDEDDAFMGDMDDFVGNQGPTFRNFK